MGVVKNSGWMRVSKSRCTARPASAEVMGTDRMATARMTLASAVGELASSTRDPRSNSGHAPAMASMKTNAMAKKTPKYTQVLMRRSSSRSSNRAMESSVLTRPPP